MTEASGMNLELAASGRCLCGAVSYASSAAPDGVRHCHCENCRRTTGNFVAAVRIPTAALGVDDPERRLRWFDLGYARYGFCSECGATLFWNGADRPDTTSVMAGTLDRSDHLRLLSIWFAREIQPHNMLVDGVPHHDGNA